MCLFSTLSTLLLVLLKLGQPVFTEPLHSERPRLVKRQHRFKLQILLGILQRKVTINNEHFHVERIQLELFAEQTSNHVGHVRDAVQEPHGQVPLGVQVGKSHGDHGRIEHFPKVLRFTVRDNVKLSESGRVLVQGIGTAEQAVSVVVDVADANLVAALPKDAQASVSGRFEKIGQEERVVGTVNLVGSDRDRHEVVAASLGDFHFAVGFRFGVHGQPLVGHGELVFPFSSDVFSREARGGRARIDEFGNFVLLAVVNNANGSLRVDVVVLVSVVEGSDQSGHVENDVDLMLLEGRFDGGVIGEVSLFAGVHDELPAALLLQLLKARGQHAPGLGHVETADRFRPSFQQEFHESGATHAAGPCDQSGAVVGRLEAHFFFVKAKKVVHGSV